jgi:Tol biopolymer transport system component
MLSGRVELFARHPAISPDGSRILFDSDRDGDEEVYVMDRDGDEVNC